MRFVLTFMLLLLSGWLLAQETATFSIFGEEYQEVTIINHSLSGYVFYVVSGHGGPDPGAVGSKEGHQLCEDEYAYDISLRLARALLAHDASAYMIVRDENDGIRDDTYLSHDKEEKCWKDQEIPASQIPRLDQRVDAINKLYKTRKNTAKKQVAIVVHIDSRSTRERVDMFFYHNPKSKTGKALAESLRNTIASKYEQFQKGRGYKGTVKSRDLHMLRKTTPTAVYLELGNLNNAKDQKRFLMASNRQAVADWLAEGILAHYK